MLCKVRVRLNGHQITAVLDSGCGTCVAGERLLELLERTHRAENKGEEMQYIPADGISIRTAKTGADAGVCGWAKGRLQLGGAPVEEVTMLCSKEVPAELIIGID